MQNSQQLQQQASSSSPAHQQQQQSFSFGAASDSFKLPVDCWDVALTQDGHSLLLAAGKCGLIDLSSASGRELSRWRPPKIRDYISSSSNPSKPKHSNLDDEVQAVVALCDRRAAVLVSLYHAFAHLVVHAYVVLLRRNEKSSSSSNTGRAAAAVAAAFRKKSAVGNDTWTEDRRIELPWSADCLSAHGDVLAASELSEFGQRLHLLSLSSGRLLSNTQLQRDYVIRSLAVTARLLVTGSRDKVELGGGRRAAQVLDAHSLDADGGSDQRRWRHVLQDEEDELWGVCADSSCGCLYAAVCRSDESSGRVSALSLADGSELRRIALSFNSAAAAAQLLLLPRLLSLCDDRAAEQKRSSSSRSDGRLLLLAALCWNPATLELRTVTLHRSTSDMLQ